MKSGESGELRLKAADGRDGVDAREKPSQPLKVALVCDWLTEIGGAEQVLLRLTKLFPDAPIYTSQYRRKSAPWFNDREVHTCWWMNILPRGLRKFMAPLRAWYFNHLWIRGYDVVISVCNAECKGVKTPDSTLHIAYLQGPPTQYYWSQYERYIANPGFGRLNWLARLGLKLLLKPMRKSDLKGSTRPDIILANSHYVLDEMKRYYQRDGEVVFPPVGVEKIKKGQGESVGFASGESYFVIAGRQVNWKRFDLAVKACGKLGENLLVIGDGPEHERLVDLAKQLSDKKSRSRGSGDSSTDSNDIWCNQLGDKTTIVGNFAFLPKYNGVAEIAGYFQNAKGFIFSSLEPFGIVPVEALACGLPILAYAHGGSTDIVEDGVNGLFFDEQTVDSLMTGIRKFNVAKFDRARVARSAERFSEANFDQHFRQVVERNYGVKNG